MNPNIIWPSEGIHRNAGVTTSRPDSCCASAARSAASKSRMYANADSTQASVNRMPNVTHNIRQRSLSSMPRITGNKRVIPNASIKNNPIASSTEMITSAAMSAVFSAKASLKNR